MGKTSPISSSFPFPSRSTRLHRTTPLRSQHQQPSFSQRQATPRRIAFYDFPYSIDPDNEFDEIYEEATGIAPLLSDLLLDELGSTFYAFWAQHEGYLLGSGAHNVKAMQDVLEAIAANAVKTSRAAPLDWALQMLSEPEYRRETGLHEAFFRGVFSDRYVTALGRIYWRKWIQSWPKNATYAVHLASLTTWISDVEQRRVLLDDILGHFPVTDEVQSAAEKIAQEETQSTSTTLAETTEDLWQDMYERYSQMLRLGKSPESLFALVDASTPNLLETYAITQETLDFAVLLISQAVEMDFPQYAEYAEERFKRVLGTYQMGHSLGMFQYLFKLPRDVEARRKRLPQLIFLLSSMEWNPHEVAQALKVFAQEGVLYQITHVKYGRPEGIEALRRLVPTNSYIQTDTESVYPIQTSWMIANTIRFALQPSIRCNFPISSDMSTSMHLYAILCGLSETPLLLHKARSNRFALLRLVLHLSDSEKLILSQTILDNPYIARQMVDRLMVVSFLCLGTHMDSIDTFADFFDAITIKNLPNFTSTYVDAIAQAQVVSAAEPIDMELFEGGIVHGRTLHHPDTSAALKVPKLGQAQDLKQEARMINVFALLKTELGLKSELPTNPIISESKVTVRAYAELSQQASLGCFELDFDSADEQIPVLQFDAPADYHVHLHQVDSFGELLQASMVILHDVAILARNGIVSSSPADLFHNEFEDRRFIPLKNLMDRYFRTGTGRCSKWKRGVEYENFGPTGIRDLKHFQAHLDRSALVHPISEYLFAWVLSSCLWFLQHDGEFNGG